MLMEALEAEVADYVERHRLCATTMVVRWWCAMAVPGRGR